MLLLLYENYHILTLCGIGASGWSTENITNPTVTKNTTICQNLNDHVSTFSPPLYIIHQESVSHTNLHTHTDSQTHNTYTHTDTDTHTHTHPHTPTTTRTWAPIIGEVFRYPDLHGHNISSRDSWEGQDKLIKNDCSTRFIWREGKGVHVNTG